MHKATGNINGMTQNPHTENQNDNIICQEMKIDLLRHPVWRECRSVFYKLFPCLLSNNERKYRESLDEAIKAPITIITIDDDNGDQNSVEKMLDMKFFPH